MGKKSAIGRALRKIEYAKSQTRAKVEHPFRVIKRQFGYTKVLFRGLVKKHRAVGEIVCAIEPVDGAKTVDGYG